MKTKSLDKILAENMLRFGTKNLGETVQKLKQLVEQLGSGDAVGTGVQIPADVLAVIQKAYGSSMAMKNAKQQLERMKIPVLCNGNIIDALVYGAIKGNAAQFGEGGLLKLVGAKGAFEKRLLGTPNERGVLTGGILDGLEADNLKFYDYDNVSVNPAADDPSKVATLGEVTTAAGLSGDYQTGSDYTELITYLNTYNLMNILATKWTPSGVQQYYLDQSDIDKTGYLDLQGNALYTLREACFYATQKMGVSKAGKEVTKSTFIPQEGERQEVPIPKDTFAAGKVAVTDASFQPVIDALTGFQNDPKFGGAGWKITGIQVETAASLGEKVSVGTAAAFSTMTGVSVADLAAAGITDANVNDPAGLSAGPAKAGRSGQDFLAITRANNIKTKLETKMPGVPVTTAPALAAGKEESRFGKVTFTVQGPNKEISIPATMIPKGAAGTADDMSKLFNFYSVRSDSGLDYMFGKREQIDTEKTGN